MYGYCKFQSHCPKQDIDEICPIYKECDDNGCIKRHPKTCKNYERNGKCRFERCAYSHEKEENNLKIEILENKVADLKLKIEDIRKTNHENLETERKNYSEKFINLNNTLADIVVRLSIEENNCKETNLIQTSKEAEMDRTKTKISKRKVNTVTKKIKECSGRTVHKEGYMCDQCDFKTDKEITLTKHTNTKHAQNVAESNTEISHTAEFKCSLCKDMVDTNEDLEQHIAEHIEEIETMDIKCLTNGHDLFECNLCSFESGHEDSVKEHLIEHVHPPKMSESTDESGYEGSVKEQLIDHVNTTVAEKEKHRHRLDVQSEAQSLLDEYDYDGNYIGDNPKFMDKHDIEESGTDED